MKISTATFNLTINPTASKAGEISAPKKNILFPLKKAFSRLPFNIPANEISPLKAPPKSAPLTTDIALFDPLFS